MNRPANPRSTQRLTSAQQAIVEQGGEGYVRIMGRNLIYALYGALRNIRMYPVENAVVQKALDELTAVAEEIRAAEGELEFRVSGEFLFVNATRLRLDLDNYQTFSYLLGQFRAC
ncbi:MAG TPA: hypothetical protein VIH11_00575, partial [Gemmatimonadaceae bacterium]